MPGTEIGSVSSASSAGAASPSAGAGLGGFGLNPRGRMAYSVRTRGNSPNDGVMSVLLRVGLMMLRSPWNSLSGMGCG